MYYQSKVQLILIRKKTEKRLNVNRQCFSWGMFTCTCANYGNSLTTSLIHAILQLFDGEALSNTFSVSQNKHNSVATLHKNSIKVIAGVHVQKEHVASKQ